MRTSPASSREKPCAWESRANNFDFLRLALAILVIYSHAFPLGTGNESHEPFKHWTHGQITGGAFAVDSFFIMSGFLIAGSAERSSSVWSFLRKRVYRIYPAFIVLALLSAVVLLPLSGGRFASRGMLAAADFVLQTLRLTDFHHLGAFAGNAYPGILNGSEWSIQYEFWCYIGVAVLLACGFLGRRNFVAGLLAGSWVWSILSEVRHWNFGGKLAGVVFGSPQFWARLLALYLVGVAFYLFRRRIPLRGWLAASSVAVLAAACRFPHGWTVAFPFAGAYLLLWFAFAPALRLHHFGRFGDFSYGTYLYAFPIEQLLVKAFGGVMQPLVLFACALPLTLAAAAASWYGIERRFLAPVRRKELPVHVLEEQLGVLPG